jgi:hypothetical protein
MSFERLEAWVNSLTNTEQLDEQLERRERVIARKVEQAARDAEAAFLGWFGSLEFSTERKHGRVVYLYRIGGEDVWLRWKRPWLAKGTL